MNSITALPLHQPASTSAKRHPVLEFKSVSHLMHLGDHIRTESPFSWRGVACNGRSFSTIISGHNVVYTSRPQHSNSVRPRTQGGRGLPLLVHLQARVLPAFQRQPRVVVGTCTPVPLALLHYTHSTSAPPQPPTPTQSHARDCY